MAEDRECEKEQNRERLPFLPPQEHCVQISFTTAAGWTLRFYRDGAAALIHAACTATYQLPACTFDFCQLHREVLRLSQTALVTGYTFHVHVLEQAPRSRPDGEITPPQRSGPVAHAFSSADASRMAALLEQALATAPPASGLTAHMARHPAFPAAAAAPQAG